MNKIMISVALVLMVAGLFQVLAGEQPTYTIRSTDQQEVAAVDTQLTPSPLTSFEHSLLAWARVQREVAAVSEPSPLTKFEQSLLRWAQLQADKQVLS